MELLAFEGIYAVIVALLFALTWVLIPIIYDGFEKLIEFIIKRLP